MMMETKLRFFLKQSSGIDYRVEIIPRGLNVLWSAEDPPDEIVQKCGIPLKAWHKTLEPMRGEFLIASPQPLNTNPSQVEKLTKDDEPFRILRVAFEKQNEKTTVYF